MPQAIDYQAGLTDAWTKIVDFAPKLLAFVAILLIGWIAARIITRILRTFFAKVGVDRLLGRTGLTDLIKNPKFSATDLLSKLVYYILMLFVLITAFKAFGANPISDYLAKVANYLPRLIVALVIVVVAVAIARGARSVVLQSLANLSYAATLSSIVSAVIVTLGAFAALNQLEIAQNVVNGVLYAALTALVGIAVVAIGGGGIKTMSQRWERAAEKWDVERARISTPSRPGTPPTNETRY